MQMTLDFEAGLSARHPTLLAAIRESAYTHRNPLKTIAADMDMSQSALSRKLNGDPEDPRRFSVDDLEAFLKATGDLRPVYYLVEKYIKSEEQKQQAAVAQIKSMAPALMALLRQAGLGEVA